MYAVGLEFESLWHWAMSIYQQEPTFSSPRRLPGAAQRLSGAAQRKSRRETHVDKLLWPSGWSFAGSAQSAPRSPRTRPSLVDRFFIHCKQLRHFRCFPGVVPFSKSSMILGS